MAARTAERRHAAVPRPATPACGSIQPGAFKAQVKEDVYRARDPPVSNRPDPLPAGVTGQAMAEYHVLAEE
jgi:hypothetical protein